MDKHKEMQTEGYSSDEIRAMKEKAAETGARPISTDGIRAVRCQQYWVGCNTITSQY